MSKSVFLFITAAIAAPAFAQVEAVPVQAVRATQAPASVLRAGTEIPLRMSREVTTKGNAWKEGDRFELTVASDVMLDEYIVIPMGTKAVGRITWLTSRGAFGKSGKMDVELEHLQMGNRRINLDGTFRQEGDGATVATVGGVLVAGPFAGFITGRSGSIPQGRELTATLEQDLAVALPDSESVQATEQGEKSVQPQPAVARPPAELKLRDID